MKKNLLIRQHEKVDQFIIYLCLTVFSVWVALLNYKYLHFGYYDWDLAFFAQAMWNLAHGSAHVSLFDTNVFANHANLIAYLILPLYKIFPHPLTLVSLKVASYVIAGFVLYILAKEKLGFLTAAILTLLYFIYPPNLFGIVYEFDFESLAPAFLMLLYYFYVKDRWGGFIICALILILIKENLPLVVLAFGIHGMFVKKDKLRWGIVPLILGLGSFIVLTQVFISWMGGRHLGYHPYLSHYNTYGSSLSEILCNILLHPIRTWHYLFTPLNERWFLNIFSPLLFLPLLSLHVLFLISPIMLQHLLSQEWQEHSIYYAYMLTVAPFLFLATIHTLSYWQGRWQKLSYNVLILSIVIFIGTNINNQSKNLTLRYVPTDVSTASYRWELVHRIPKDAAVVASFCFLAELSQRKDLYAFYKIYDPHYQRKDWSYRLPKNVEYALIDFNDPWLKADLQNNFGLINTRVRNFLSSGWVIEKRYGSIVLYKRKG